MKLRLRGAAVGLFVVQRLFAQGLLVQGAPSTPQRAQLAVVATLKKNLDAKKLTIGDRVTAQVIQDVVMDGKLVVPRQSKIVGHVVDVQAFTKGEAQARLALVFDLVQLKKGGTLNFRGVLAAVSPPLFDPFAEAALSSPSPYGSGANGPANKAMISAAQITNPTYSSDQQSSGAIALKNQHGGVDHNDKTRAPGAGRLAALDVASRGVLGIPGLYLVNAGSVPTLVSVGKNLEIESGSQIVIALEFPAPANK